MCGSSNTCCNGQCNGEQCCSAGSVPCGTTCCTNSMTCINQVCAPPGSIACGAPGVAPGYCPPDSECTGPQNNVCCPQGFTVCTGGIIGGINTEYDQEEADSAAAAASVTGGQGGYGQYGGGVTGNPCCGGQCNPQSGICCPPTTTACGPSCCDQTQFCSDTQKCCKIGAEQGCGTK